MTFPRVRPRFPNQVRSAIELVESIGVKEHLYEWVHQGEYRTWTDGPFWITKMTKDRMFVRNATPQRYDNSNYHFYSDAGLEQYDSGVWNPTNFIRPYKPGPEWQDDWF